MLRRHRGRSSRHPADNGFGGRSVAMVTQPMAAQLMRRRRAGVIDSRRLRCSQPAPSRGMAGSVQRKAPLDGRRALLGKTKHVDTSGFRGQSGQAPHPVCI